MKHLQKLLILIMAACFVAGNAYACDTDGDGVEDIKDNCPLGKNPDQLDTDRDKKGDLCDADDDNDGLTDIQERELGTWAKKADTDGDGINDGDEVKAGTDPKKRKKKAKVE